jgi:hypothetical protein
MDSGRTYNLPPREAEVRSISSPDHSNGIQVYTELNREVEKPVGALVCIRSVGS